MHLAVVRADVGEKDQHRISNGGALIGGRLNAVRGLAHCARNAATNLTTMTSGAWLPYCVAHRDSPGSLHSAVLSQPFHDVALHCKPCP